MSLDADATPDYPSLNDLWQLESDSSLGRVSSVQIVNYRSIKATTLSLQPFTVLVGANGAGKSNVVDVFRFVSEALSLGLYPALERRGGIQAVRHKVPSGGGRQRTVEIKMALDFSGGTSADYQFRIISGPRGTYRVGEERIELWTPNGHQFGLVHLKNGENRRKPLLVTAEAYERGESWGDILGPRFGQFGKEALALPFVAGVPGFANVFQTLRQMRSYAIVPDLLREPQDPDEGVVLHADGRNASSVWQELEGPDKKELVAMLGHAVPGIADIKTLRYGRKRGFEFLQAVEGSKR